jgi:hypothetical protein
LKGKVVFGWVNIPLVRRTTEPREAETYESKSDVLGVQRARAEQGGERERKRQLARTVTERFVLGAGRGHQSSRAKTEENFGNRSIADRKPISAVGSTRDQLAQTIVV